MESLIRYINQFVLLDRQAIDALYKYAEIEHFPKNSKILEEGQYCRKIWFIKKGMVRKYYWHKGKEITTWMHTENDIFTSLPAYAGQIHSTEFIEACESTELISISRKNSEKLAQFHPFVEFSNLLMEKQFVEIDVNTKKLNQLDASGKYSYLCKMAPELIKRAKLGHIASILGITQETLSRIRKRI